MPVKILRITNSPDARTAQERVLAIPELFTQILLALPLSTLLLSNSVSKHWQETIATSQTLQEHLFFSPLQCRDDDTVKAAPQHNPLLKSLFPPLFRPRPALTQDLYEDTLFNLHDLRKSRWYQDPAWKKAVLRPEASWRNMYPIQPPSKITEISDRSGCGCAWNEYHGAIADEMQDGGVRMGVLYDVVVECLDMGARGGGMMVQWMMFEEPEDFEDEDEAEAVVEERTDGAEGSKSGESEEDLIDSEDDEYYARRQNRCEPRQRAECRDAIEIYFSWERDCYAQKSDALTGLEVVGKVNGKGKGKETRRSGGERENIVKWGDRSE